MEQMKGVFSKMPVKALDRIPPTVGLNGKAIDRGITCSGDD